MNQIYGGGEDSSYMLLKVVKLATGTHQEASSHWASAPFGLESKSLVGCWMTLALAGAPPVLN